MSKEVKELIPLPVAVAITVVVSLPFGMMLGEYNLPLWVSFISWAEYFVFGAKPEALKKIFISFPVGGFLGGFVWMAVSLAVASILTNIPFMINVDIANFIVIIPYIYLMLKYKFFTETSLAYLNGLSMMLGVYFTGAFPKVTADPYLTILVAWIYASIAGIFGGILGWFNVTITFPRPVEKK